MPQLAHPYPPMKRRCAGAQYPPNLHTTVLLENTHSCVSSRETFKSVLIASAIRGAASVCSAAGGSMAARMRAEVRWIRVNVGSKHIFNQLPFEGLSVVDLDDGGRHGQD